VLSKLITENFALTALAHYQWETAAGEGFESDDAKVFDFFWFFVLIYPKAGGMPKD
jgi:hypothetical protein